jgi:Protein of unknown function (DUF2591)
MKIKTSELIGQQLDWAVAKCEGKNGVLHDDGITRCIVVAAPSGVYKGIWCPTVNWAQGGPIIEREAHNLFKHNGGTEWCCACNVPRDGYTAIITADGPTPLIAAMRCYVASKLGAEVDIPEELLKE